MPESVPEPGGSGNPAPVPPAEELQFRTALPVSGDSDSGGDHCVACKNAIIDEYFHAQGQVVCPLCANKIESGQQAPPALSLIPAVLYGGAAAFAGFLIYAAVGIFSGLEVGLIAILVGIMVGKAIRHASKGMGGRPQQILAVALTYFAISSSYIPIMIHSASKGKAKQAVATKSAGNPQSQKDPSGEPAPTDQPKMTLGRALLMVTMLALAAPFLTLFNNLVSGALTLFIMFLGLRQAWTLTGRTELLVMGPYRRSEG